MHKYRLITLMTALSVALALLTGCGKAKEENQGNVTPLGEIKTRDAEEQAVADQELEALRQEAEDKRNSVVVNPTEREEAESLEYVPREELAGNKLPYFLKEIKIVNENTSKEYVSASVDPVKLRVYEIDSIHNTAGSIIELVDEENKEDIEQVAAMFVSKEASDEAKIDAVICAIHAHDMGAGLIDKVDYKDNKLTAIDANGKKVEHDLSTDAMLFDGKNTLPDEEEYSRIAQMITEKYGITLSREEARQSSMDEEEQKMEEEELARLKEATEAAQAAQAAVPAAPQGMPFTDKVGNTAYYTTEEWNYLKSLWEYTGHADDLVRDHTNTELRQILNQR